MYHHYYRIIVLYFFALKDHNNIIAIFIYSCYESLLFCRSLLNRIDQSDSKQLRLVFDSMDKNRDGQLSREELEEFAIELG